MIRALRKYLFATNIVALVFILVLKQFVQVFCRLEALYCTVVSATDEKDAVVHSVTPASSTDTTPIKKGIHLIPSAMRKARCNFGYGEGHFQMFVEEKPRNHASKARLNATAAEAERNPN